jgi:hypothetical protein
VTGLPARNVVIAAVATPVGPDYRPDGELLLARCRQLLSEGCDGITLFGTQAKVQSSLSPTGNKSWSRWSPAGSIRSG